MRVMVAAVVAAALLAAALHWGDSAAAQTPPTWTPEPVDGMPSTSPEEEVMPAATATPWPTPTHRTNHHLNRRFGHNFLDVKSVPFYLFVAIVGGLGFAARFRNAWVGVGIAIIVLVGGAVWEPADYLSGTMMPGTRLQLLPLVAIAVGALGVLGIVLYVRQGR